MAHTITPQVISGGGNSKFVVVKYTIQADSKDASELNTTLFDASAFGSKTNEKLFDIEYCLNGFVASLAWHATSNVPLMSLAKDHPYNMGYFPPFGGLPNNGGAGVNGDIDITTVGLASTSYTGHIILRIAWK